MHRNEIPPGTLYLLILRTLAPRRARYYQLTPAGRKQLDVEMSQFERVIGASTRVIEAV